MSDDSKAGVIAASKHNSSKQQMSVESRRRFTVMASASQCCGSMLFMALLCSSLLQLELVSCQLNATAATKQSVKTTQQASGHCVVVLENTAVVKQIGAVWENAQQPCAIHACQTNTSTGHAQETITSKDCEQFYCDIDSVLEPRENTCCGVCVRKKCRFNDNVYDIGQIWQNNASDCMQLECVQLPNGEPIITTYRRNCPPLPTDCARSNVYIENCCEFCNSSSRAAAPRANLPADNVSPDIWTEEFYSKHPCVRECQPNEEPRTCHYTFVVEWFETLSKACYNCPQNVSDCFRPHCIVGDGVPRTVTVVNRMMPGPAIEVCERDQIVVDVHNQLLGESTTMHWHGIHQKRSPYMDGVPHITQCPISPHATFRYSFEAANAGTQFWHSHTGMQRGDGVFGALIVRRPRAKEPHAHLYDFDLSEHKMIVQDWVHVTGVSIFSSHHHSRGDNKPRNLLINGRGRYYKGIWDAAKTEAKLNRRSYNMNTEMPTEQTNTEATTIVDDVTTTRSNDSSTTQAPDTEDIELLHPIKIIARSGRVAKPTSNPFTSPPADSIKRTKLRAVDMATVSKEDAFAPLPETRHKRATDNFDIPLENVPLLVYHVRRGFRYRFRIINAEFLNCPIAVSIDKHNLTAINSDGYDFEAVEVGSIVTYAGERFDFVLNANQPVGNYWVRLKGLMDCSERFGSAFQVAILRYEGAADVEPKAVLGYNSYNATGIELNAMNRGSGQQNMLTVAELKALPSYDTVSGIDRDALIPVADYKFFVYYDFYAKDNPVFHPSGFYGINDSLTVENQLFTPQLNHISLKFPADALLPSRNQMDDSLFCNETTLAAAGIDCRKEFCKCHHVLQVPLNAIVELIIIDEGFTYDANHPFHLHGNAFRVVGLERLGQNVTVEMVKQLDSYNLLKRNLVSPPVKDTVTVPDGGYTIVRFEASNPGFWLFHCHIEFHAEIGMALVIKVGGNDDMLPVPKNFPTCHDYKPAETAEMDTTATTASIGNGPEDNDDAAVTEAPTASAERLVVLPALLLLGLLFMPIVQLQ